MHLFSSSIMSRLLSRGIAPHDPRYANAASEELKRRKREDQDRVLSQFLECIGVDARLIHNRPAIRLEGSVAQRAFNQMRDHYYTERVNSKMVLAMVIEWDNPRREPDVQVNLTTGGVVRWWVRI